ncbi:RipA family octameric membrane protein [Anabaena sp. WFMT]|uniref:RipA family octameric membrane protein n=1 Tax=Anabaena sp. WFMT TaxID=3449730 RepID=UPI003F292367
MQFPDELKPEINQIHSVRSDDKVIKTNSPELAKNNYGENFQLHLLEEYKIYVEMMDRNSARRGQINAFYTTLLSAILTLIFTSIEKSILPIDKLFLLLLSALLGIFLCFVWIININSYKQLSSLKFKVIHEMEKYLPYPCYAREWQILKEEKKNIQYWRLTQVEKYVPLILAVPYLFLLIYSLIQLFNRYFTKI